MKKKLAVSLSIGAAAIMGFAFASSNVANTVKAEDEITIKPFAKYTFQDAENLGKDTSGNGFDLLTMKTSVKEEAITQQIDGDGTKYLSIRHDVDPENDYQLATTGGAWLYAPELGSTNKDFTDLIEGSYTVTITIRAQYSFAYGNAYAVNFGRYCSTLQFVPWSNGVEIATSNADFFDPSCGVEQQDWLQSYRYVLKTGEDTDWTWQTITVTGNVDTGVMKMYLNGSFAYQTTCPGGTKLTNTKTDLEASSYAFSIGGQCDVRGGSVDALIGAVCDYKEVAIYDCLLSDENVAELYAGKDAVISKQAEGDDVYVTAVEPLKAEDYDLEITDLNTVNGVIKDQLSSKKVKVTTSDGTSRSYRTVYYPSPNGQQIMGKVITEGAVNVENTKVSLDYKYVCKIDADPAKVEISEVELDGNEYEVGEELTGGRHTIKFWLTPKDGITIEFVSFNDMDWDPEDDSDAPEGTYEYYVTFSKGAAIHVETSGEVEGGPTTSSEEPTTSSVESSAPVASSSSSQAASSQPAPTSSEQSSGGGCGGSVAAMTGLLSIAALAVAGLLTNKRREK